MNDEGMSREQLFDQAAEVLSLRQEREELLEKLTAAHEELTAAYRTILFLRHEQKGRIEPHD